MTNEQEQVVEPTFRTKRMRVWETRVAASAKSMAGDLRIYCAMADNGYWVTSNSAAGTSRA